MEYSLMMSVIITINSSVQMSALVVLSCAVVVCAYALIWQLTRRARRMLAGLPTFEQLPFIGNIHQVLGNSRHIFLLMLKFTKMLEETGKPIVIWLGPQPFLIFDDPDDVRAVTNAFVEKPYLYSFAREWVGNGLVTAPAAIWKRSIKKLAGTFTTSIVEGYQDVFNAQATKLVSKLKGEAGKEPFDAKNYMAQTTLEAICQTALGVSSITDNIVNSDYYTAFQRTFELMMLRGSNFFLHADFIYRLTPAYRELKKNIAILHNVSNSIIKKRRVEREAMRKNGTLAENNIENGTVRFKAFLEILFELSEVDPSLTEEQIRSEVDTIIVGGHETVATTIFMSTLMLGCKPDVQEKLHAEMTEIFGDSKRSIQKEDMARMRYCEAVINETLRMYPPIPVVCRISDRDLQLKSFTLPKGTVCAINAWSAGRSKRLWGPDADQYRPERWLGDDCPPNLASFVPFSYGKRACIGKRYAMAILKTLLSQCVRELIFTSDPDKLELTLDVALKASCGHMIQVRLRE